MDREEAWHETPVRVRYGEVDRMGVVYHGHYLVYFEIGRTELLRSMGSTYREVEESGTLLVVIETGMRFLRPGRYDDHLTVRSRLAQVRGVRLRFEYEVMRDRERLATGHTVLAATDPAGRPRRLPAALRRLVGSGEPPERKASPAADVQGERRSR